MDNLGYTGYIVSPPGVVFKDLLIYTYSWSFSLSFGQDDIQEIGRGRHRGNRLETTC